jgi:hypothetical protein
MATFDSVAKELAEYILSNNISMNIFTHITNQIDNLTYTNTGLPISTSDKLKILDLLEEKLKFGTNYKQGDSILLGESEDSTIFIDLVKRMKDGYKNGK